jgi:hypothetical protein
MKSIRMRTFDVPGRMAVKPTTDVLLTPPTPKELAAWAASMAKQANLGAIWDGGLAPILDGLDPASRKAVLARIAVYGEMKDYDTSDEPNRKKAVGALDSGTTDFDPFGRRESAKLGEAINARNRAAWGKPAR